MLGVRSHETEKREMEKMKKTEMRKFVVVVVTTLSIGLTAVSVGACSPVVKYSEKDFRADCDEKGGVFSSTGISWICTIGTGRNAVTIIQRDLSQGPPSRPSGQRSNP